MVTDQKHTMSEVELSHVGEGALAYLREIDSDDLKSRFPGIADIQSGMKLWALFAANGRPILLADQRDLAMAGAFENDLVTVSIH
jgi:hypothetical protein